MPALPGADHHHHSVHIGFAHLDRVRGSLLDWMLAGVSLSIVYVCASVRVWVCMSVCRVPQLAAR